MKHKNVLQFFKDNYKNSNYFVPETGNRGSNSGVRQPLTSSGQGEISNFKVPGMHLSFFRTEHGLFKS